MPAKKRKHNPARKRTGAIKRSKGRPTWIPSYTQKLTAYKVYKEGASDREIARALLIGYNTYRRNKGQLEMFFERKLANERLKVPDVNNKPGRPPGSKLDDHPLLNARAIRGFASAGYSMSEVAKIIGCSKSTLSDWLTAHPSLKDIFTYAKDYADMQVIKAMERRAKGLKVKECKILSEKGMHTDTVKYYKYYPPDAKAGSFYLVNRKRWSRDSEHSHTDNKGKILEAMEKMTEVDKEEFDRYDKELKGNGLSKEELKQTGT